MKYSVTYNRMESRVFVLSTSEIEAAVRDYVEKRQPLVAPASARQEIEVSFDGDCHAETATLTQRFIYDDEIAEAR